MNTTQKLPECIGLIMDGNRRWAKAQRLDTLEGHKKGADVFIDAVRWARDRRVRHIVFYGFSSENWSRSTTEVEYLMQLFAERIQKLKDKLMNPEEEEKKVRFRFIGNIEKFKPRLQELIKEVETESESYNDTTVWVALSYGGRAEIVEALNKAVANGEPLDEHSFRSLMWSASMPDPDIIVRTGGEQRLSNFLTWQSVYSELMFFDTYWPDITLKDLDSILETFAYRKRNFGK